MSSFSGQVMDACEEVPEPAADDKSKKTPLAEVKFALPVILSVAKCIFKSMLLEFAVGDGGNNVGLCPCYSGGELGCFSQHHEAECCEGRQSQVCGFRKQFPGGTARDLIKPKAINVAIKPELEL